MFSLMVFMAVAIMVVFIVAFSLTIGTLAWVYSAEVLTEKGKEEGESLRDWIGVNGG